MTTPLTVAAATGAMYAMAVVFCDTVLHPHRRPAGRHRSATHGTA